LLKPYIENRWHLSMKNKAKKSMVITAIIVLVVVGVLALNFAAINFIQNSITANAIREGGHTVGAGVVSEIIQ